MPGAGPTRTSTSASTPCSGEHQRYQNGFDCQGLWVEVNVERDLGFTSKRDIEAYGIAEFVTLCKQRVLTYAARQTEQSIRLGMWMDWNDPNELRRLHDLLGSDPAAGHDDRGTRRTGHRQRGDARRAAWACPMSGAAISRSATRTTT
ncbi:MAG: class I tRNA ligase family protein [Candidatus Limnocylindrales bacterium]